MFGRLRGVVAGCPAVDSPLPRPRWVGDHRLQPRCRRAAGSGRVFGRRRARRVPAESPPGSRAGQEGSCDATVPVGDSGHGGRGRADRVGHGRGTRPAPGAQLWVARYNGPAGGDNEARAVAVDPGGRRVFVTGQSYGGRATGADYATVAYSAATGRRLWVGRFAGNRHVTSRNRDDIPTSMAVTRAGGGCS